MLESFPARIASVHFCCQDGVAIRMIKAVSLLMMGDNNMIRFQCHNTDDQWEARYKLMSYGIPVDLLPFTDTGNVKIKNFVQWTKVRKLIENKKRVDSMELVECPLSTDVVYKIGTGSMAHPGNVKFRDLLEANFMDYHKSTNHAGKQAVVRRIMEEVLQPEGRFLEWDSRGCWIVIRDPGVIRAKISNSILYLKRMTDAKHNVKSNKSSTFIFERQDGRKRKRDGYSEDGCGCG